MKLTHGLDWGNLVSGKRMEMDKTRGLQCSHPLPETFPETSRIFPDCGFLICLETEPEMGRRNVTENMVSPTWFLALKNGHLGLPGQKRHIVTSRVATFDHEIETWSGLGKSGAGETDGNGTKTELTVLTSLPRNLPGVFPELPRLRVF